MADEVYKFVNSDVIFIERPHFYDELKTLVHTTGDSVDEALFMSGVYLSDIDDVGGYFPRICGDLLRIVITDHPSCQ